MCNYKVDNLMDIIDLPADCEIVVVSSYFNPNSYKTKRSNYEIFVQHIKDIGGQLVIIECAFNDREFDLPPALNIIRVQASSVLWQKERLLNLAISKLPSHINKVAWVDCDLIFENKNWLVETCNKLNSFNVVQPFEVAVRLPRDHYNDVGEGDRYIGFGATFVRNPLSLTSYNGGRHGHSGFAWAARREVLKYGLYESCISGNGDHLMAHAFTGDWETECFRSHFEDNIPFYLHFESWCRSVYPLVRSNIGYVQGKVIHLWHGDSQERKYMERNKELNSFEFNPVEDICIDANGCLCWNSSKPDLHRWARRYFGSRNEDGKSTLNITKDALIDRLDRAKDRACSAEHALKLNVIKNIVKNADNIEEALSITRSALGISGSNIIGK